MWRAGVAAVLLVAALGGVAAGSAAPGNTTGTATPADKPPETLRERVEQLPGTSAPENASADDLRAIWQDAPAAAQDVARIRVQMKHAGAWHPDNDRPAVVVLRVQHPGDDADKKFGLFQYCGPGNGGTSFNGRHAWCEIPITKQGQGALGYVRVEFLYTPPGINATHEFSQSTAESALRRLERRMNTVQGYLAWTRWNNAKRHSAETKDLGAMSVLGVVVALGMYGVAVAEARTNYFQNIREEQQLLKQGFVRSQTPATLPERVVAALLRVPVVRVVVTPVARRVLE